ncbi:MAG: hypothetical protein R3E53_18595 [Myxococcota bacterium]
MATPSASCAAARGVKEVFVAGTSVHRDGEGYSQARPGAIVEGPSR